MSDQKTVKNKKKKHPVRAFFSLLAIVASVGLIVLAAQDFITTLNLRKEIADSQSSISNLQNQEESLNDEKEKLKDSNYVQRYARGKYMVSKPGEQVFKLPSKDTSSKNED